MISDTLIKLIALKLGMLEMELRSKGFGKDQAAQIVAEMSRGLLVELMRSKDDSST